MIRVQTQRPAVGKALVLGFLLAALVTMILLAAGPAHADTTFTVNSTNDAHDINSVDGVCDVDTSTTGEQCTFRAAIEVANATSGVDTIHFDIPGSGVHTIAPNFGWPIITDPVTIDGYSQPGTSENTLAKGTNAVLLIELDGTSAGEFTKALEISAPNSVVKGLVINRFGSSTGSSIVIDDSGAQGSSRVEGNFIGTDPSGTQALGNRGNGVTIFNTNAITVGGASPEARNLISGNGVNGVSVTGSTGVEVVGNLIGTDKDETGNLGNGVDGVAISSSGLAASGNTVGGASSGAANTIAFNGFSSPAGDGITVYGTDTTTGNRILSNSIFSNRDLGIDLADDSKTANDKKDPDTGPNTLQNFPVITSAITSGGKTKIRGTLNSRPNESFTVQFFSTSSSNEGKELIGQKSVSTDSNGNVGFAFKPSRAVKAGQKITATATDADGNTSEFSAPRKVAKG